MDSAEKLEVYSVMRVSAEETYCERLVRVTRVHQGRCGGCGGQLCLGEKVYRWRRCNSGQVRRELTEKEEALTVCER